MITLEQLRYAEAMRFEFRLVTPDGRISSLFDDVRHYVFPDWQNINPHYVELVFVHTEEEAQDFPDNVVAAWPRMENRFGVNFSEGLVGVIQQRIGNPPMLNGRPMRSAFTLEDFDLTYPLTVEDLVDNWEKVDELRRVLFDWQEWRFIQSMAWRFGLNEEDTNE